MVSLLAEIHCGVVGATRARAHGGVGDCNAFGGIPLPAGASPGGAIPQIPTTLWRLDNAPAARESKRRNGGSQRKMKHTFRISLTGIGFLATLGAAGPTAAMDAAAAESLARKSGCLKCHGIDKKKDGPSYKSVAEKYKGKPDAVQKITEHITIPNQVEIDGKKEDHELIKSKDPKEVRNVVDWILSR